MAEETKERKSRQSGGRVRKRPLSPHLTVYKPQITSVLSIAHRGTGVFLLLGAFVLAGWLMTLAAGEGACQCIAAFLSSDVGRLFLLAWAASLFYHLANGIRHLFWDAGYGFELGTVTLSGIAVLAFTVLATLIAWWRATGG